MYCTTSALPDQRAFIPAYRMATYETPQPPPVELVCYHCGNTSGLVDSRGMCISCGAELEEKRDDTPKDTRIPEQVDDDWGFEFSEEDHRPWWKRIFKIELHKT